MHTYTHKHRESSCLWGCSSCYYTCVVSHPLLLCCGRSIKTNQIEEKWEFGYWSKWPRMQQPKVPYHSINSTLRQPTLQYVCDPHALNDQLDGGESLGNRAEFQSSQTLTVWTITSAQATHQLPFCCLFIFLVFDRPSNWCLSSHPTSELPWLEKLAI